MQSMYFLIPISLVLFVLGIFAIYYAIKSRQFDDLDNESQRVILDDRQFRREQLGQNPAKPSSSQPPKIPNTNSTKLIGIKKYMLCIVHPHYLA
jgi:cbb3-type cytochrome oxidase maturation protein